MGRVAQGFSGAIARVKGPCYSSTNLHKSGFNPDFKGGGNDSGKVPTDTPFPAAEPFVAIWVPATTTKGYRKVG